MWDDIIKRLAFWLRVTWAGFGVLAAFTVPLGFVLFIVFTVVVYAATFGSDVPLKAACSDDTVFIRYKLVAGRQEFWKERVATLDRQIQGTRDRPAEIQTERAKAMKMIRDSGVLDIAKQYPDQRTPAQRKADELRRQADAIEDQERDIAFLRVLEQEIAELQVCKARALEQLAKPS